MRGKSGLCGKYHCERPQYVSCIYTQMLDGSYVFTYMSRGVSATKQCILLDGRVCLIDAKGYMTTGVEKTPRHDPYVLKISHMVQIERNKNNYRSSRIVHIYRMDDSNFNGDELIIRLNGTCEYITYGRETHILRYIIGYLTRDASVDANIDASVDANIGIDDDINFNIGIDADICFS